MGDLYEFIGEDTNLDDPNTWFDETSNNPGTVPGSQDVALIEFGQMLTGTLNVSTLLLEQGSGDPPLSLSGTSTQITAAVGVVAGTATLESGAVIDVDTLEVLGGGTALLLQSGAEIVGASGDDASISIGTTTGASLLSIAGLTSNFSYSTGGSLLLGDVSGSTATLSVVDGGALSGSFDDSLIGAAYGATATLAVSGAGSVVELNGSVEIGDEGTGIVRVEKGGYASLGAAGGSVYLGNVNDPGSAAAGSLTVAGTGSEVNIGAYFYIGEAEYSSGHVAVSAGGVLSVSGDTYLYQGAITVSGGGAMFDGRTLLLGNALPSTELTIGASGTVNIVTLDLYAGKVALTGGDMAIRRSAYISSGTTISGYGTVNAGAIYNSGLVDASGGTLSFIGPVSQSGLARVESGATLEFGGTVTNGLTVTFEAASGTLALGDAAGFAGVLAGFAGGQTIDLLGVAADALSKKGTTLVVKEGSKVVANIAFKAAHTLSDFKLSSDGHGGMDITYTAPGAALLHGWHA